MQYTIQQGKHRAWPLTLGLWFGKKSLRRRVYFHKNCAYQLPAADQQDCNKLFGVSYFPHHHQDSARFGWWYNPDTDRIKIVAYCYVAGERVIKPICEVPLMQWVDLRLFVDKGTCFFDVENCLSFHAEQVPFNHQKKWAYPLGVFFGGNNPAPHRITIQMLSL